jgi:hypothetical protein
MNTIERDCKLYGCCTVSSGTLRTQDLIPAYLDTLRELAPAVYEQTVYMYAGFSAFPAYAQEDPDSDWWHSDDAYSLLESLSDALSEHAPDGYRFGGHEGDGACFGFWKDDD